MYRYPNKLRDATSFELDGLQQLVASDSVPPETFFI
jgi:hypothetical protein